MRSPVAVGGGSGSSAAKVRQRGGAPLLLGQQQGQQQGELQEQPLQHLPREDQRASSLCFRRLRLVTPVAFLLVIVLLLVLILQPPGEQQLQQQEEQQRREQLEACAASAVAPGVVLPALKASTRVCSRTELRNPAHNPLPAAHPEYDFSAAELEQAEQTPEGEAVLAGSLSYAVTFAVLPRRYYLLPAVLGNLLRQSHVPPPTLVVVNAPSFPEESLACWTDDRVAVRVLPDVGPITKVLYTIRDQDNASALAYRPSLLDAATGTVVWAVANLDLTGVDAFLVCDDDNIKGPLWAWLLLRRLVELQILRGRKVHELHQLQAAAADEGVLANANSSLTIARLQREAESLARPAFLSLASIVFGGRGYLLERGAVDGSALMTLLQEVPWDMRFVDDDLLTLYAVRHDIPLYKVAYGAISVHHHLAREPKGLVDRRGRWRRDLLRRRLKQHCAEAYDLYFDLRLQSPQCEMKLPGWLDRWAAFWLSEKVVRDWRCDSTSAAFKEDNYRLRTLRTHPRTFGIELEGYGVHDSHEAL